MLTQVQSKVSVDQVKTTFIASSEISFDPASKLRAEYVTAVKKEREQVYSQIIESLNRDASDLQMMEIGAGSGSNIFHFNGMGMDWQNLYANEISADRVEVIKSNLPTPNVYHCDALDLPFENSFDVVFQSTVFTSILSEPYRIAMAKKMWKMLKKDGIILWYDFEFNNPKNPNVRKATRGDVLRYFPQAVDIKFHSVTLAPPIGRRIGKAYWWMNALFPFLRSHLIAVVYK